MAKRRANGEGNLRKRKDGRWEGRYTAGRDPETGKAIYKNVLGKTQAEVKAKLKQAIEEAKGLDAAKASRYTVGQWMEVWFEHYAKVKVVCQFLEFAAGVTNRKRLCHHFPKGTENGYHAFPFGNIYPCHIVHVNRSSSWICLRRPAFSIIAGTIYLMTRAHQCGGSICINRTLRMRGWLTDFPTDAMVLGGAHQAKTLSF